MELYEKLNAIENKLVEIAEEIDYTEISNKLEGINIIKGARHRGQNARLPLIALYLDDAEISHAGMSNGEVWEIPVIVVGAVVDPDPEEGRRLATNMVAKTRDELLKDRSLRGTVNELKATGFLPADERGEGSRKTFGAGASLEARFIYRLNF